ncbi:MAG: hypothetical protein GY913_24070 [Proteobacteria bacterium]|nr:hypothetical protein [Pseudomonadota bacterium]MCP4919991.1 hypothetical protein [Pseudomonadota bacterium]
MLLLLACAEPPTHIVTETVVLRADSGHVAAELAFAGIESVTWADGQLVADWSLASGEEPIRYEVVVSQGASSEGGELLRLATDEPGLEIPSLADGEYRFRVEAIDAVGDRTDGGVELTQLFGDNRVVWRSEVGLEGAADVWGEGDHVVLAGRNSDASFLVVDISVPTAPVLTHTEIDGGFVKDIKIGDGLMFTNGECGCRADSPEWEAYDRIGVRIWDFTDPWDVELLGTIGGDEHPAHSVHNVSYGDGIVYVTDNLSDGVGIYDVSDPTAAVHLGDWLPPIGGVHDQVVIDGLLYVAFWSGFAVLDVTDPADPIEVHLVLRDDPAALHNIWPSSDGRYVFTTDEMPGGHVRVYDLQTDGTPQVAMFQADPAHVVHNVHVRDEFLFVSSYLDGIHVLDVTDATDPVLVGWYDSFDEDAPDDHVHDTAEPVGEHEHPEPIYDGAWGIWPYGDVLAVGDMRRGLILLEHVPDVVE